MIAVHFEEQCAIDDDYGKRRPIRLFESRDAAIAWLESVGYKKDIASRHEQYIHAQYHSEMRASFYEVADQESVNQLFKDIINKKLVVKNS